LLADYYFQQKAYEDAASYFDTSYVLPEKVL